MSGEANAVEQEDCCTHDVVGRRSCECYHRRLIVCWSAWNSQSAGLNILADEQYKLEREPSVVEYVLAANGHAETSWNDADPLEHCMGDGWACIAWTLLAEVGVTVNKSNHEVKYWNIGYCRISHAVTVRALSLAYLANLLASKLNTQQHISHSYTVHVCSITIKQKRRV